MRKDEAKNGRSTITADDAMGCGCGIGYVDGKLINILDEMTITGVIIRRVSGNGN